MLQNLNMHLQHPAPHSLLVRLAGDLDMFTCAELKDALNKNVPDESYRILIDLERVRYIDSMGLATLLACVNHAQHCGGHVAFVCNQPNLLKLFAVTGINRVLKIYPGEVEARRALDLPAVEAAQRS